MRRQAQALRDFLLENQKDGSNELRLKARELLDAIEGVFGAGEKMRQAERRMHIIWGHYCAGRHECKPEHKPLWQEIQGALLTGADILAPQDQPLYKPFSLKKREEHWLTGTVGFVETKSHDPRIKVYVHEGKHKLLYNEVNGAWELTWCIKGRTEAVLQGTGPQQLSIDLGWLRNRETVRRSEATPEPAGLNGEEAGGRPGSSGGPSDEVRDGGEPPRVLLTD